MEGNEKKMTMKVCQDRTPEAMREGAGVKKRDKTEVDTDVAAREERVCVPNAFQSPVPSSFQTYIPQTREKCRAVLVGPRCVSS